MSSIPWRPCSANVFCGATSCRVRPSPWTLWTDSWRFNNTHNRRGSNPTAVFRLHPVRFGFKLQGFPPVGEGQFTGEQHDYIRNDYMNWGFIQLEHNPVKEVKGIRMMYGNRPSMEIPLDWVKLDKLTGQITLFPVAGSANSLIIGQTGLLYGFQSQWDYAPMLWEVDYVAGIDEKDPSMPFAMLKEAISKRAACGILNVWGDLIIGAGIASQSVSIDGISQSIGTTQSAMYGGASARIQAYTDDLKNDLIPALRQKFGGIRMTVI